MICRSIIREIISSESIIMKNENRNPLFIEIISKVIQYFGEIISIGINYLGQLLVEKSINREMRCGSIIFGIY